MRWMAQTTTDVETQVKPMSTAQHDPPKAIIELVDGERRELDIGGLRSEEILRVVLSGAGGTEADIELSVEWAVQLKAPKVLAAPERAVETGYNDK